ncbi:hypothetical protein [Vibrio sp. SCSIO 43136]|uniref:hypothetical protein n=1 Tax=Vibrio sp. SCSIO 43136 TaxID=2819101 RepID=UPI002075DFFE|nr:hypothetical protein [Vibrio sp. SCSIO 43136]USD64194.1 hypothetical protein J4N39_08730 [Vibrio sp. SCSIO 43136]
MLKKILHVLLGYRVVIYVEGGPAKHDEPLVTRCWLSKHCSVRAMWHGTQVRLNTDKTVTGLPPIWNATWKVAE